MMKWKGLFVIVCLLVGSYAAVAFAGQSDKVTLCHLADGPAQAGLITVAPAAAYNGHYLQHTADIIPPFEFQGETYSLNWTGSFPEECAGVTTTEPGTTTEEPPPPTTTEEEPPSPPTPTLGPSDDPPASSGRENCPDGLSLWKGKCYKDDAQKQPDGSVVFGEQG
jgi:hypothetical protein